ncbi:MAG: endonuclease/exonuclease/phosphatase family protein [Oscillospiraceae bacterium]|jgi:endonuclease/exonuclease/phosphatase family metal-dependent hydrolase|nr:endonuclease/exonuclease/phosphatase family protein [Oscillospiraceae bacterium]
MKQRPVDKINVQNRNRQKTAWWKALAVCLLVCALLAASVPTAAAAGTLTVKAMTFNLLFTGWWARSPLARAPGIVDMIRRESPDIIGTQETIEFWRIALGVSLWDEYGFAANIGKWFGFIDGSTIMYKRSRFECIEQGVFWLAEVEWMPWISWGAKDARIAGWAVLKEKSTGKTFRVINAHMDWKSAKAREESAKILLRRIKERDIPTILLGDFNSDPSAAPHKLLVNGGIKDAYSLTGAKVAREPTFHDYQTKNPWLRIDYIMGNKYLLKATNYKTIKDKVNGEYLSDHFPIEATLTLSIP